MPLCSDGFPIAWADHFLSPPFFKEGAVSAGSSLPASVPSRTEFTTVRTPQKVAYAEVEGWTNTSAGESDLTDVEDVSSASSAPQSMPEPAKVTITPSMARWHESFLQRNRS